MNKYVQPRAYADPDAAARKLVEIANSIEAVQDGRIHVEKINAPFLYQLKSSPAEYGAGMKRAIENGWLKMHESGTFCTVHASRRRPFRVSRFAILARLSIFSPPRKPIELPPGFARRFVDDMRAYFAETNLIKRDEIAARQLHALRQHYGGKLRLTDVTQMLLQMRDPGMTVWIYVDTSKQVGDKDHLKVFATEDAAGRWFAEHDPEGVAFEYEVTK